MTEPNMTLELVKSRASILPEGSDARVLMSHWVETGHVDEASRAFLCYELVMAHGWGLDDVRAIMRAALECEPAPVEPAAG